MVRKESCYEEVDRYVKKYPVRCVVLVFLILSIGPPLIIHCIYKIPALCSFWEFVIPPGNMIAYLGTVMTFCATFSLSIIVYIQNRKSENRTRLLENRTFISMDAGERIEICTPSVKKEMSLMFQTEINVLSNIRFSSIILKYMSIRDESICGSKKELNMEFDDKKPMIQFQYKDKSKVKLSFGILKVEDYVMELFRELKSPTIGMDIDFICENVITPITIILILEKNDKETKGIEFVYNTGNAYIHHHKEKFV